MRKLGVIAATAVTLTGLAATGAHADAAGGTTIAGLADPERIAGRYIVVLEDGAAAREVAAAHEQVFGASVDHVYRSALRGYSARMGQRAAEQVARLPAVDFVQADSRVSTTAQSVPTGIDRANADASPTAAIDGTDRRVDADVAVIDTGVDLDHPDLNVYRAGATNCALLGVTPDDQHGHGTHVAGTIGALDNATGVVGVAPGARVWPVKVLNAAGTGSTSDVVCGIDYVTAHADQIEVANMSLGSDGKDDGTCGETNSDAEHKAICASVAAGVTYAVAAGNDSADAATSIPAAYDEVITVSALADFNGRPGGGAASTCRDDVDDTLADFSNYGSDVDLLAPGVCIRSTWMGGGYDTISGTSMASPHVAGAAALYAANHPGASPAQVRSALESAGTADWDDLDDPDDTQEPLLDVTGF
jgi:subtilisin